MIWNLVVKEWKQICYSKVMRVFMITGVLILIIGTCFSKQFRQIKDKEYDKIQIGVVNLDQSKYSNLLIQYFKQDPYFSSVASIYQGSKSEIEDAFASEKIAAYLIIPEDFVKNMQHIKNTPVQVKINGSDTTIAILIQNTLRSYEKYILAVQVNAVGLYNIMEEQNMDPELVEDKNVTLSLELVFTALGRESLIWMEEVDSLYFLPINLYFQYAVMGIIILYLSLYVGYLLLQERQKQIISRGKSVSMTVFSFCISKIIAHGAVLSVILLVCNGAIQGDVVKTLFSRQSVAIMGILFLGILVSQMLSLICQDKKAYMIAGNMLYLCFIIVGGGVIPYTYLPESMQWIGRCSPIYWFIQNMI